MPYSLIIGAGNLGGTIGRLLSTTFQTEVHFFDTNPAKVPAPDAGKSLEEQALLADIIFIAVPAAAMQSVMQELEQLRVRPDSPRLKPDVGIICLAKGLDPETGQTSAELFQNYGPDWLILSGPMLASELEVLPRTYAVLGYTPGLSLSPGLAELPSQIQTIFAAAGVKLTLSEDILGIAWLGVLKNIYALGLGIAEGLDLGMNLRGSMITQALMELRQLIPTLNGAVETVDSYAGVGDLVTTGFSVLSTNHQCGIQMAQGITPPKPSEGMLALPLLAKRVELTPYPLLNLISQAAAGNPQIISKLF